MKVKVNYRKITRTILTLSVTGLIVGSCVQSLNWFGEMTVASSNRYRPTYYNDYYNRSSTRYNTYEEEIEDVSEIDTIPYPDYNRTYPDDF